MPPWARGRLIGSLIDSLDGPPDADAAVTWDREITRRLNALDAGKAPTVPWTEADRGFQARRLSAYAKMAYEAPVLLTSAGKPYVVMARVTEADLARERGEATADPSSPVTPLRAVAW